MSPPGRPRSFDEDEILEAALQQFWSAGFEGTSVADLERATGLGRQSLYNAFGDKQGLFIQAVQRYGETRASGILAALRAPGSPLAALRAVVDGWAPYAAAECRSCLAVNSVAEHAGRSATLCAPADAVLEAQARAWVEAVERAQAAGEIRADVDADSLGRTLQALGAGLMLQARQRPGDAALHAVVRGAHALIDASTP